MPAAAGRMLKMYTHACTHIKIYTKKYTTSGKHMHFVKLNIYARVYIKKRMCMQGYPGIKKYTAKHIQHKRRKKRMHKQAYARK